MGNSASTTLKMKFCPHFPVFAWVILLSMLLASATCCKFALLMLFSMLSWLSSLHSWELLWWVSWGCEGTRGRWVRPSLRGKQAYTLFSITSTGQLHSSISSQCIVCCQVRALIEGQFLSKRAHTERFGMPSPPLRIIATGGASANENILSLISAIFGCDVYTVQRPGNSWNIQNKLRLILAWSPL